MVVSKRCVSSSFLVNSLDWPHFNSSAHKFMGRIRFIFLYIFNQNQWKYLHCGSVYGSSMLCSKWPHYRMLWNSLSLFAAYPLDIHWGRSSIFKPYEQIMRRLVLCLCYYINSKLYNNYPAQSIANVIQVGTVIVWQNITEEERSTLVTWFEPDS
jgi:hypothetical protein